jgi:hypothetical protein
MSPWIPRRDTPPKIGATISEIKNQKSKNKIPPDRFLTGQALT